MSRVVRKETLYKYISLGQKSDLETWIPVTSIDREVSRRCQALNLEPSTALEPLNFSIYERHPFVALISVRD